MISKKLVAAGLTVGLSLAACGGDTEDGVELNLERVETTTSLDGSSNTLVPESRHTEVVQSTSGLDTFEDPRNAGGFMIHLAVGEEVTVDCWTDSEVESAPQMYHIIEVSGEPYETWAAANAFENGDTSGPLSEQPAVDPAVRKCP